MIKFLINVLVSSVAVFIASKFLAGVEVDSFVTAIIVALVLGLVNAVIRPIVMILTLPINILTLGLFTFVINALLILLVTAVVPGFMVDGILWALIFSVVLAIVNGILEMLIPSD